MENFDYFKYYKEEIAKMNTGMQIKIRAKTNRQKRMSLYLDYVKDNKREFDFPQIYIIGTKQTKSVDKENLKLIQEYRNKKESELLNNRTAFQLVNYTSETNIFDFIEAFGQCKARLPMYLGLKKHLKKFFGEEIKFSDINKSFCEGFRNYLLKSMGQLTAKTVLSAFKAVINKAVKDEIISVSPCRDVIIKAIPAKREFLVDEEIVKIIECKSIFYDVKNAFLFSCFTGLRLSDIKKLTYEEVQNGYLHFRQRKTGDIDMMKLTEDAEKIIKQQKNMHPRYNLVFKLPESKDKMNRKLKQIISSSEISKKITFHCGRHTFATRCINKGVDIFTVQKLLGHRDLDATLIYAKLVDTKRDEYVDKMTSLLKNK